MKPIYVIVTPYFPSARCWRGSYCYDFAVALMRLGEYDVHYLFCRRCTVDLFGSVGRIYR